MTREEKENFFDEGIIRLLNIIDEHDNRIADLRAMFEATCANANIYRDYNDQRFAVLAVMINDIAAFVNKHNDNLASLWTLINEAERTFLDGDKQKFTREELSAWFHKIRRLFNDILNPAVPVSLSTASGKTTAANAENGATESAEAAL